MKNKFTLIIFALILTSVFANAQNLLLREDFAYPAGIPLVANPIISTENIDPTTGWRTMNNINSVTNSFNIVSPALTYAGYDPAGTGNAMKILDNAGQDIFKSFSPAAPIVGPATIYISFLINVPPGDKNGTDFIFGIKYTNSGLDANYFGRLFITVTGNDVFFGISKSTSPAGATTTTAYKTNTTYLIVMKYFCGGLNGTTTTEETGKFDDKIDLFINPTWTTTEPATPTLTYSNVADKDAYRYSSTNTIIGGLAAIYFRTPTAGAIPEATFDAIRVMDKWGLRTGVNDMGQQKTFSVYTDEAAKRLTVKMDKDAGFNQYDVYSMTGQQMTRGKVNQSDFSINVANCPTGTYYFENDRRQNNAND